jgi:hypothetical protein
MTIGNPPDMAAGRQMVVHLREKRRPSQRALIQDLLP